MKCFCKWKETVSHFIACSPDPGEAVKASFTGTLKNKERFYFPQLFQIFFCPFLSHLFSWVSCYYFWVFFSPGVLPLVMRSGSYCSGMALRRQWKVQGSNWFSLIWWELTSTFSLSPQHQAAANMLVMVLALHLLFALSFMDSFSYYSQCKSQWRMTDNFSVHKLYYQFSQNPEGGGQFCHLILTWKEAWDLFCLFVYKTFLI